jgi:hypothetical protein
MRAVIRVQQNTVCRFTLDKKAGYIHTAHKGMRPILTISFEAISSFPFYLRISRFLLPMGLTL